MDYKNINLIEVQKKLEHYVEEHKETFWVTVYDFLKKSAVANIEVDYGFSPNGPYDYWVQVEKDDEHYQFSFMDDCETNILDLNTNKEIKPFNEKDLTDILMAYTLSFLIHLTNIN